MVQSSQHSKTLSANDKNLSHSLLTIVQITSSCCQGCTAACSWIRMLRSAAALYVVFEHNQRKYEGPCSHNNFHGSIFWIQQLYTVHLCQHLLLILAHCFPGLSTTKTAGTGPTCQGSHGVNRGARRSGSSSRAGPAARKHGFCQARLPGCWQAVHTGGLVNHTSRKHFVAMECWDLRDQECIDSCA